VALYVNYIFINETIMLEIGCVRSLGTLYPNEQMLFFLSTHQPKQNKTNGFKIDQPAEVD
jgi:hypothetical protein